MNEMLKRFCLSLAMAGALVFGTACGAKAQPAETMGDQTADDLMLATFEWDGETHEIYLSQIEKEIAELPDYRKDDYEGRDGRAEYLTLMAESRVLLERAREIGLDQNADIEAKVETYQRDIMLDAVQTLEVEEKAIVTDEDIQAYYEANLDKYKLPEQIRLTCVTVQDEEQAKSFLEEIKNGERTLDEIATGLSEHGTNVGPGGRNNGDTGLFGRDTWPDANSFVNAAFDLEVGETTDEIVVLERQGETYYMVFRQEERNAPRQQTLDEVRTAAQRSVQRETTNAREKAWAEELRQIGRLTIHADRLPAAPTDAEGEEIPADEVVMGDMDVAPDTVIAEWTWENEQHSYTWGQLQAHFDELRPYRKSRYKGPEGWATLADEIAVEELKALESAGLGFGQTDEDLMKMNEYRNQLMVEELVKREVDEQVEVTDEKLRAYHEEHASEYVEDEKTRITCITFDDREEAYALFEEIKGGRDIQEAAQTLSDLGKNLGPGVRSGGDTGLFSRKTFGHAEAFTNAAFSTPVGEIVSEPVYQEMEGTDYYMIFRVEERTPERQQTLDEVRSRIQRAVERIEKREQLETWLSGLKERAKLAIFADRLPEYPSEVDATDAADAAEEESGSEG